MPGEVVQASWALWKQHVGGDWTVMSIAAETEGMNYSLHLQGRHHVHHIPSTPLCHEARVIPTIECLIEVIPAWIFFFFGRTVKEETYVVRVEQEASGNGGINLSPKH